MAQDSPRRQAGPQLLITFAVVFSATLLATLVALHLSGSEARATVFTNGSAAAAQDTDEDGGAEDDGASTDSEQVTMTLLHNNDGESKLLPNAESGFPGIARFTQQFQDLGTASESDILLRVTSGDNFLASKEFTAGLARAPLPLYDAVALSGLYEAMALGNHDFDFGPDVTAQFIRDFSPRIPFLAANIDVSSEPELQALVDDGRLAPSTIITDDSTGLRVGVIGAITPRLANISSPRDVEVDADIASAVNAQAEALVADGVDRIVLISHLQGLEEDRDLLPELRNIDIVVAGGGDELLSNDGDTCLADEEPAGEYPLVLEDADGADVLVVTAPGGYRCIGQLHVTFDSSGVITDFAGSSIGVPLEGPAEEYAVESIEDLLSEELTALTEERVARNRVALDGRRAFLRTGPTNLGELMADALLAAGGAAPDFGGLAPDVAIQNAGGIRNDAEIPVGNLSAADTFDIAPFANFAVTVEVPRERFKELLETAVSGLPEAEGSYPQIAGFEMTIDAEQPARDIDRDINCELTGDEGSRVQSVVLDDGTVIVEDGEVVEGDPIVLATIDFLAGGGDCYPLDDLDATSVGVSYQQALATFVAEDLDGRVRAGAYPEGGSRATVTGVPEVVEELDESDDGNAATDDGDAATDDGDTDAATDDGDTDAATDDGDDTELPNTGAGSWLIGIIALTGAGAGLLIANEAKRAGRLSLRNRLRATGAWIPGDGSDRESER